MFATATISIHGYKKKETVARNLVINDLNHLVCVMATDERRFDIQTSLEIYTQMKELARARRYLRYPYDPQKEEDNVK